MESADYIVVGGGSAGCVAASELAAADPGLSVVLLECGAAAEDHPETLRADGYKDAFANDALIWDRFSAPQAGCGGARKFMGSGRGMGGSGSVNAMVYTRGAALDYDEWPEGWRWADLEADFERVEAILRPHRRPPTRWTETCIEAAEQVGFTRSEDLNDGQLGGVLGYEWMNYEDAERRSSYVAFVRDRALPNLRVLTGTRARRIIIEEARATGVEVEGPGGTRRLEARREVVMCAGALETPKLLLLSGIGPAAELRRHGIPGAHELPVGENLHDHPNVTLFFAGKHEIDCAYPQLYGFHRANVTTPLPLAQSDTCYVFYPARSSLKEAAQRMLPALTLPPGLYHRRAAREAIRSAIRAGFLLPPLRRFVERMWGIAVILGKPLSRGRLTLESADPKAQARLDPAYFSDPRDLETLYEGVRFARRIAGAPALSEWGSRELAPGPWRRSRDAVEAWIKSASMTTFHFAGTCRMGADDDTGAVVDTRLRVRGVHGLRVADASVVPSTPVSALNAPSMVIGFRGARFALEERRELRATG